MVHSRKVLATIVLGGAAAAIVPLAMTSVAMASTIPSTGFPPPSSALTFLAPLTHQGLITDNLDGSLVSDLTVLVVNPVTSETLDRFTAAGNGPFQLRVTNGGAYHVNWKVSRAQVGNEEAIVVEENGTSATSTGLSPIVLGEMKILPRHARAIPIQFSIQNNPAIRARQLRLDGDSSVQVANDLKTEFGLSANVSAELLAIEEFDSVQTAQALQTVYNQSAIQTATILQYVQYDVNEIASALKTVYADTGFQGTVILKSLGYTANQVAGALQSVFNETAQQAASVLQQAQYTVDEVAGALQSVFQQSANQVAAILNSLSYSANQIASTLSAVFGQTTQDIANILQQLGYSASQVTSVLSSVFSLSQQAIGSILKDAGYTASEIGGAIQSFFGSVGSWFSSLF